MTNETEKRFETLTTEQLRAIATKTDGGRASWHQWTREMLLAFFHNRRDQFAPHILETK